jgi:zinc transporter ZupT
MIINSIILFVSAICGGMLIYVFGQKKINIQLLLVFAGAYLFSITVIHILPELFENHNGGFKVGLLVLGGFYFQHILEYFTSGVEHGHIHHHPEKHAHSKFSGYSLMIALCIHAFLEGTLIAYPEVFGEAHKTESLLFGVILHKVPAAFALMSVLTCQFKNNKFRNALLALFAVASPLGLITGSYLEPLDLMNSANINLLFAFVAGNFLHISTTIFIESSPEHSWNSNRLFVSVLGATAAVLAELLN